jgi:hypothetical protein
MAQNFSVHTDANYRIRDDIAPLMQSSRYFNKNNCMAERSLRRNILSDHFVQPYTKNFDDGACDYDIARQSDLKIGNHNYYNRPQNYEDRMGLTQANMMATNPNSKLDQAYNLVGGDLGSLNSAASKRPEYYPYAYGGNLAGQTGSGVMGNFAPHDQDQGNLPGRQSGYFEPYKFRTSGGISAGNELRLGRPATTGGTTYEETNFGKYKPMNSVGVNPTHAGYNANLNYKIFGTEANPNTGTRSYAGTSPKMNKGNRGMSTLNEGFRVQHQPREGFFFESGVYSANNAGADYEQLGDITSERIIGSVKDKQGLQFDLAKVNNDITNVQNLIEEMVVKAKELLNPTNKQIQGGAHVPTIGGIPTSNSITSPLHTNQPLINVIGRLLASNNFSDRSLGNKLEALRDEHLRLITIVQPNLVDRQNSINTMINNVDSRQQILSDLNITDQQRQETLDQINKLGLKTKYMY